MVQRMDVDGAKVVACPRCLKMFSSFETQKNRDQVHPIVPSHLPDVAGANKVATEEARRKAGNGTVRPF